MANSLIRCKFAEFPILESRHEGQTLIYLDNGATTQKPRAVIDAINKILSIAGTPTSIAGCIT